MQIIARNAAIWRVADLHALPLDASGKIKSDFQRAADSRNVFCNLVNIIQRRFQKVNGQLFH
nr:hypothetical protein [Marinicella sp. W31]MDC2880091.1 hypothetical protein [Marinicella sp. W31]